LSDVFDIILFFGAFKSWRASSLKSDVSPIWISSPANLLYRQENFYRVPWQFVFFPRSIKRLFRYIPVLFIWIAPHPARWNTRCRDLN
jgi:hypothetical protein